MNRYVRGAIGTVALPCFVLGVPIIFVFHPAIAAYAFAFAGIVFLGRVGRMVGSSE